MARVSHPARRIEELLPDRWWASLPGSHRSDIRPRWETAPSMNAADLYRKAFASLPDGELDAYSRHLGRGDPEIASVRRARPRLTRSCSTTAARCRSATGAPRPPLRAPVDDFSGGRRLAMLALIRADGIVPQRRRSRRAR